MARLPLDRLPLAARRPALAEAGLAVFVPDMRGYGDSDKPPGVEGYDARALANEARALVAQIGFGRRGPVVHAAHDMGELPALLWAAHHPDEVKALLYIEAPVMLGEVLRPVFAYTPESMGQGSMWWWILPLAPGVPERLIVGNERSFLDWFYEGDHVINHDAFTRSVVDEYLRTFSGRDGVLGSLGIYRAAFTSIAPDRAPAKVQDQDARMGDGGEKGLGARVWPDGRVDRRARPDLRRTDQRTLPARGGARAGGPGDHSHHNREPLN